MPEMKKALLCAILVTACFAEDPCSSPMRFTDLEKRASTNKLASGETPLSDRYIEEGWYGYPGMEMSTKAPDRKHCGTVYPVYLKESVPNSDKEEIVDVCIYTDKPCGDTLKMRVKRCGDPDLSYIVYYLTRLPMSSAAYCIGSTAKKGEYPEYKTTVDITVDIPKDSNKLVFYCNFSPSTKERLWYTVLWYVDDKWISKSKPVKESIMDGTRLEEDTLLDKGISKVGFNIKCAVVTSFQKKSPLSMPSTGKDKFIGIKILTPKITLKSGEQIGKEIKIQPTAPIGCIKTLEPYCKLNVDIVYPAATDEPCDQHVKFEHTDCTIGVDAHDSNKITTMKIMMSNKPTRYLNGALIHRIKLQTATKFIPHRIWGNYSIGDVEIQLEVDTGSIQSKLCQAVSDPHILPFDGSKYDHHYSGIFTLYENTKWKQEVQFKTSLCNPKYPHKPYCICGLAVRAGRDVFVLNHCSRQTWSVGYPLCEEPKPLLGVKNVGGSKYEITLPSGTTLEIDIMRPSFNGFIDVRVTPSRADENATRGLCGNVNKQDNPNANAFYSRNVSLGGNGVAFSMSWSVSGDILNLFKKTDLHKLTGSNYKTSYCNCKLSAKKTNDLSCDNTLCKTITPYKPSRGCTIRGRMKKRSVSKYLLDDHQYSQNEHRRVERSADDTWRNGWTAKKAKEYCTSLFKNSSAVQLCKDIPTVDLDGPMNNCVLDIKFMGDTSFALVAVETVKNKCYQEVNANTTLREESEPGKPSIFDQVKVVACPLECSHRGDCKKGICKCKENYGGIDCSVDIRDPPIMEHLSEDGYCDLSDDECSEVSVFGGDFVETENSSCKINSLEIDENGTIQGEDEMIQPTDVESLGEAICTLPKTRTRRSTEAKPEMEFVKVYKVSVANNGIAYSNESVMVIFNSRCQYCTVNGLDVRCSFTGDFCMSGGVCYENGEPHGSHESYVCSATNNSRSWLYSKEPKEVEQSEEAPQPLWIIGVVLGSVALIFVGAAALWYITVKSKRKIASSPDDSKAVVCGTPPYSTAKD